MTKKSTAPKTTQRELLSQIFEAVANNFVTGKPSNLEDYVLQKFDDILNIRQPLRSSAQFQDELQREVLKYHSNPSRGKDVLSPPDLSSEVKAPVGIFGKFAQKIFGSEPVEESHTPKSPLGAHHKETETVAKILKSFTDTLSLSPGDADRKVAYRAQRAAMTPEMAESARKEAKEVEAKEVAQEEAKEVAQEEAKKEAAAARKVERKVERVAKTVEKAEAKAGAEQAEAKEEVIKEAAKAAKAVVVEAVATPPAAPTTTTPAATAAETNQYAGLTAAASGTASKTPSPSCRASGMSKLAHTTERARAI